MKRLYIAGRWWGFEAVRINLGGKGPAKRRNRTENNTEKEMGVEKGRGKLTGCSTTTLLALVGEASIGASFAGSTLTSSPFIFPFQTRTAFFFSCKDHFLTIEFPPHCSRTGEIPQGWMEPRFEGKLFSWRWIGGDF